jgi:acyl carrier protein
VIRGIRFHAIQRRLIDALLPKARPTGLPTARVESSSTAASTLQHEHGTHPAFPSTVPSTVQSRAQSRPVSTLSSPPSSLADDHHEAFKTPTATAPVASSHPSSTDDTAKEARIARTIKSVVAQELNLPLAQLPSSAPLADLGIDSLMLLALQTRLRDATGKHVPASCFARPNSLDEVVGWVVKRS